VPATESLRGGRQIAPMLRLLSGDLVLDEPDDFDIDDLPALTRLVHWAGLLGSGKKGRRQLNRLRPPWPATCTTSGRTSQRTFHHRLEARISQGTLLHEVLPHRVFVFLGLAPA